MSETLTISEAARRIRAMTGRRITYNSVWRRIQDEDLLGMQDDARRWAIKTSDVDAYAAKINQGE